MQPDDGAYAISTCLKLTLMVSVTMPPCDHFHTDPAHLLETGLGSVGSLTSPSSRGTVDAVPAFLPALVVRRRAAAVTPALRSRIGLPAFKNRGRGVF